MSIGHFITKGDKQKCRLLERRCNHEANLIDTMNAGSADYKATVYLGKGAWMRYEVVNGRRNILVFHPKDEGYKDPVNGLAMGTRVFVNEDLGFSLFYDRDEGVIFPLVVARSIQPWIYRPVNAIDPIGVFMKTPGKYTGEMRKVVQALISIGAYIPYNYKANECHGVYTAANNSKWIVRIGREGIHVARMPLRSKEHFNLKWLGYSPKGVTDDMSIWPDYKRILGPSALSGFYDKDPIYSACGWAFNANGHAAQNCAVTLGSGGSAGSPSHGYRYLITISEVDNTPSLASMTLIEDGSFAMDRKRGMKYPSPDETYLDMYLNQDGRETLGDNYSAPRHVFYDGDQAVVIRSESSSGSSVGKNGSIVANIPAPFATFTNPGIPWLSADSVSLNTSDTGTYYITSTLNGIKTGTIIDGHSLGHNISSSVLDCNISEDWEKNHCFTDSVYNNRYWPVNHHTNNSTYRVTGVTHLSSVVIPNNDRECAYQYHWSGKGGGDSYITDAAAAGSGRFDYTDCGPSQMIHNITQNHDGNSFHFGDQLRRYLPNAPDADCHLYETAVPEGGFGGSRTNGSSPEEFFSELHVRSSGGIDEQLWTDNSYPYPDSAYNNDVDINNPQWMYVHRDNTQDGKTICAKYMNAANGSGVFSLGIDESKYPANTLANSTINVFWVGDPHCVNNDCEE